MADTKTTELQTQLDLQAEISQVLQSRLGILKAQEKALTTQVQLAVDMCKALKCEELDEVATRLENVRKEMEKAATSASNMNEEIETASEEGVESTTRLGNAFNEVEKKVNASNGAVVGLVAGIVRGFGSAFQTVTNLMTGVGGLVSTFFNLGTAIVGLPFKLLDNLLGLAQGSVGGSPSPIRIELENIRKEFGDLSTATGKVAASSLAQFRKEAGNLGGTGLALRRIYGSGPEGLAKAMAENLELMKALGPAVDNFSEILENNAGPLAAFRRGLGLSAEQQAEFMKSAQSIGKDPMKAMNEFASQAINMGDKFGISAKLISKDMAEMNADVANFGSLGPKAFSQISVYARKLGVEVKALTGLISAFDDFESAAQGAAKLSQAFGMNVDAMKMMQEQDPAARLSMLQKSLKDTGKSFEQMNRSEQKLLASQAGLDESTAKIAFSQRGMSMSYDQVQKEGDKAAKKQLTQEQIMTKLAKSIERVLESMQSTQFESFFDAFAKGFTSGIMKSKEFKEAMRAVAAALLAVFRGGVQVGKMFVKFFPGIKEMLAGIKSVFSPDKFRKMMAEVKEAFTDFFKDLQTDPKAGVEKFLDRFKNMFKKFFSSTGPGIKTLVEGGKLFLKAMGGIFKAVLPMVLDGLVSAIKAITEFIKAPPGIPDAVTELFATLGKSMIELLSTLWQRLSPALGEMFSTLFEKAKPYLMTAGVAILALVFTKIVLNAIMIALSGAVAGLIGNKISQFVSNIFSSAGIPQQEQKTLTQSMKELANSVNEFVTSIGEVINSIANIPLPDIAIAGAKLLLISLSLMPSLLLFFFAAKKLGESFDLETAAKTIAATIELGLIGKGLAEAILVLEKIKPSMVGKAILAAAAAALLLISGILVIALAVKLVSKNFSGIDWKTFAKGMISLVAVILSLGIIIGVAALIGASSKIVIAAILGLATAALFLGALYLGLPLLNDAQKRVNETKVKAEPWIALAKVFASIAIIAGAAAAMIGLGPLGAVGITATGVFLAALTASIPIVGIGFLSGLKTAGDQITESGINLEVLKDSFENLAKIFGAIALISIAAAIAGILSTPAAMGMIPIMLLMTALAFKVKGSNYGLLPILEHMSKQVEKIEFGPLAVAFVKLAVIFGALALIAGAAAVAGQLATVAVVGIIPLALLVWALKEKMIEGIKGIYDSIVSNTIDFDLLTDSFIGLAKAFGSLALVAAGVAAAGILSGAALISIIPLGLFVFALNKAILPVIGGFVTKIKGTKAAESIPHLQGLTYVLAAIGALAVAAIASVGTFVIFLVAIPAFKKVIEKLSGILDTSVKTFVQKITRLHINANAIKEKVEALGEVFKLLAPLSSASQSIASVGSGIFNSSGAEKTLNAANRFVGAVVSGAQKLIELVTASSFDEAKLESAKRLGEGLRGIGDLIKALSPDPGLISALKDDSVFSDNTPERIAALTDYMTKLLDAIKNKIGPVFDKIKESAEKIEDPEKMAPKIRVLGDSFRVLGSFAQTIIQVAKGAKELTGGKNLESDMETFKKVVSGIVESLFSSDNSMFAKAFKGIFDAAQNLGDPAGLEPKIRVLASMFEVIAKFASVIGDVAKLMPEQSFQDKLIKGTADGFADRLKLIVGPDGLITKVVESLTGQNGIGKVFDSMKVMLKEMPGDEKGLKEFDIKSKILVSMFEVLGKFAAAMKDIASLGMVDGKINTTAMSGVVGSIYAMLFKNESGVGSDMLPSITSKLGKLIKDNGKDLVGKDKEIKSLTDTFEMLANFAKSMREISDALNVGGATINIKTLLENVMTALDDNFVKSFGTLTRNLAKVKVQASAFTSGRNPFGKMSEFASKLSAMVTNFKTVIGPETGIVSDVDRLGDAMHSVQEMFARVNEDPNTKLAIEIGKKLHGSGKVTIKHEAVNINLAVDIKMSAEQIGKGVIKWSDGSTPAAGNGQHRRFATVNRANDTVPDNLNTPGTGVGA